VLRADAGYFGGDDYAGERTSRVRSVLIWLLRRPVDSLAGLIATGATAMILVNALFLQSGPHPAPIFANRPPPPVSRHSLTTADAALRRPRPADVTAPAPSARPRGQVLADIQRELSRRGFYDGAVDGIYGPKTDAAIRDFEQVAGLRASAEPNEPLLQSIVQSPVKAKPAAAPVVRNNDPIANLLAADPRVMAVQRALSSYGYGQIKPTGAYDPQTRAAIETFERERKLPITGRLSDRLTRELTALTGRPLE
jgi:peptidoglycan hydrolase-like protein with peptidoglycan-binding domain